MSLATFGSLFLWYISHIGVICFGKSNGYGSTIHTKCILWPACNSLIGEGFVPIFHQFLCPPTCVCVGIASLSLSMLTDRSSVTAGSLIPSPEA